MENTIESQEEVEEFSNKPQYTLSDIKKNKDNVWLYTYAASLDGLEGIATKTTKEEAKLYAARELLSIIETKKELTIPSLEKMTIEPNKLDDFVNSLKSYCNKNKFGEPFYSIPIEPDRKSTIRQCHCNVLIVLYGNSQFLDTIGHGKSSYLSKQNAAELMHQRLTKLFTKILPKNKTVDKNKIIKNIYDGAHDNKNYETKKSIKNIVDRNDLAFNHFDIIGRNDHVADSQWNKILPNKNSNLDSYNSMKKQLNSQKKNKSVLTKKSNYSSTVKQSIFKEKCSSDNINENIDSNKIKKLSNYHGDMVSIFGHDKKLKIRQDINQLKVSLVDFSIQDYQANNESNNDSLKSIDYYIKRLDDIMVEANVAVDTSVYISNDKRFIRVIRVTTEPEIVEMEIGCQLDSLGHKALSIVIDKLRELMT